MARGIEGIVDSRFPAYFILGVRKNGRVDIADVDGGVATDVAPEQAARLLADRVKLRRVLTRALEMLPDAGAIDRVLGEG